MKREAPVGVVVAAIALVAMVSLPFVAPIMERAEAERELAEAQQEAAAERQGAVADGVSVQAADRAHGHELPLTAPHWYATVHGGEGALAQVFAIDGSGKVIGPVLGPMPAGEPPLSELRGMAILGNGDLAVMRAKMDATRVLVFGPPDARTGIRPFRRTWTALGPGNPAMLHAYQIEVGPDGALYASNQDTNTITRYHGLGSGEAGKPMPVAAGLAAFGTLLPGTVVPNDQQSPEGLGLVRGFAFGPDGLLYVCDRGRSRIAVHDPATGRLVRVAMDAMHGLEHPIQVMFKDDGRHMLVTDNKANCVWRMSLEGGKVDQLVRPGDGGLDAPSAIALRDHVLYVGSRLTKQILKYDAKTGRFLGVFAELPSNPEFLKSVPG
jgi:DNA-binding beta-propeller fold protein YncE